MNVTEFRILLEWMDLVRLKFNVIHMLVSKHKIRLLLLHFICLANIDFCYFVFRLHYCKEWMTSTGYWQNFWPIAAR